MFNWLRKRPLALVLIIMVLFVGWLAFRPELLFVNKSVDEPFPTIAPTVTNPAPARH